jgi:hypothetical protein
MQKRTILIVMAIIINACLQAQARIDYFPKPLAKELGVPVDSSEAMSEMNLSVSVTKHPINGKFFEVCTSKLPLKARYAYIGRVNTCRAGGCSANNTQENSDQESEFFFYYILFDSTAKIVKVKIFDYQSSHGHGITSKGWLRQFEGFDGREELVIDKHIDAISGATISVAATVSDIEHKTAVLHKILGK